MLGDLLCKGVNKQWIDEWEGIKPRAGWAIRISGSVVFSLKIIGKELSLNISNAIGFNEENTRREEGFVRNSINGWETFLSSSWKFIEREKKQQQQKKSHRGLFFICLE